MDSLEVAALLNGSKEHAADLEEAAEILAEDHYLGEPASPHRMALAARLKARAEAIRLNTSGLL